MNRMRLLVIALGSVSAAAAVAAAQPFHFDRRLAVEVAISYTRSHFRTWPADSLPDVDYTHPSVVAVMDDRKRRLVFVTFLSSKRSDSDPNGHWGVAATFQLCKEPSVLRVIDVTTADPIETMRADYAAINERTFVAHSNDVCPVSEE
jgi:hypothetical protein